MKASVERGRAIRGVLPDADPSEEGSDVLRQGYRLQAELLQTRGLGDAYALAVSEENASGGVIRDGAHLWISGVMRKFLYHLAKGNDFKDIRVLHAFATAGSSGM